MKRLLFRNINNISPRQNAMYNPPAGQCTFSYNTIMIALQPDPLVPRKNIDEPFTQKILMTEGNRLLGRAQWSTTSPTQGVVQILELWIDPPLRRAGHGHRLLHGLIEQARNLHNLRGEPLRRLWIGVGHKTQVVGRSFLTSEGFHHVGTTCGLMHDEDLLIYLKSLD